MLVGCLGVLELADTTYLRQCECVTAHVCNYFNMSYRVLSLSRSVYFPSCLLPHILMENPDVSVVHVNTLLP